MHQPLRQDDREAQEAHGAGDALDASDADVPGFPDVLEVPGVLAGPGVPAGSAGPGVPGDTGVARGARGEPRRAVRPAGGQPRRPIRPAPAPPSHFGTAPVVGAAVTVTAGAAAFDLALTGRLSMFFDLCFVLVGLSAALLVHRRGLFAAGVLPPLLLASVVAAVAVTVPAALTASHLALVSTWLTGLAHHGGALLATHLVVLAVVGLRACAQRG